MFNGHLCLVVGAGKVSPSNSEATLHVSPEKRGIFLFRKHEQGNNAKEIPMFDPLIAAQEKRIAEARKLVFSGKTKN